MTISEQERVALIERYAILDTPPEADFDDLAEIASEVCGTPIAVVNIVTDRRQFFKAEVGLGVRETPLETGFCRHAILAEDFMMVEDATKDARFEGNPLIYGPPHLRFYAGAVLRSAEGHPIGTVCVLDYKKRHLDEHQIRTLKLLARQAMTQLEMRRLIAERDASLVQMRQVAERRVVLTRELSHRMKNMLAMVQSIVTQTFRTAKSMDDGREAISSRLAAMARAQDILAHGSLSEAPVRDVVESALMQHRTGEERIRFGGPHVVVDEQQVLGLTLAVHELATNAAKYGAMSTDHGTVDIAWSAEPGDVFVFDWTESGGPPVEPPDRKGFGSRLIEQTVATYFDGTAQLDFAPDGVRFHLEGALGTRDKGVDLFA